MPAEPRLLEVGGHGRKPGSASPRRTEGDHRPVGGQEHRGCRLRHGYREASRPEDREVRRYNPGNVSLLQNGRTHPTHRPGPEERPHVMSCFHASESTRSDPSSVTRTSIPTPDSSLGSTTARVSPATTSPPTTARMAANWPSTWTTRATTSSRCVARNCGGSLGRSAPLQRHALARPPRLPVKITDVQTGTIVYPATS